jgi:hypothetical protein
MSEFSGFNPENSITEQALLPISVSNQLQVK